jgi:carbon storage regulator
MLVLTRKLNERIQIGDGITITVVRIGPGTVRIGVEAPPDLTVLRGELIESQGPSQRELCLDVQA